MYLGQVMEIRKQLADQGGKLLKGVKVQSVDNYQGEENKIVIVSCVRNNTQKKIGNF
jgi:superfamily I DNA and/or RNA helicase